jgi:plasmid stabilization system protein ParE
MSYRVQVLPAAELDAWKIFRLLNKKSRSGADRWYAAFLDATDELSDRPERRALAPEAKRVQRPIREAFFKTPRGLLYRLIYLIVDDEVRVLRVRAPGHRPLRRKDLD